MTQQIYSRDAQFFVADWFLLMTLNGVLMGYDRTFLGDVLSVTVQLIGMFKCFDKPCE